MIYLIPSISKLSVSCLLSFLRFVNHSENGEEEDQIFVTAGLNTQTSQSVPSFFHVFFLLHFFRRFFVVFVKWQGNIDR